MSGIAEDEASGPTLAGTPELGGGSIDTHPVPVADPTAQGCVAAPDVDDGSDCRRDRVDQPVIRVPTIHATAPDGVLVVAGQARVASLTGLSAKQNREIPPLRYGDVYRLKAEMPELEVVINGGVGNLDQACDHLALVDGAMIGRAAYKNPWMLAHADRVVFGVPGPGPSPDQVINRVVEYAEKHLAAGGRLGDITRHILGLFQGVPGARAWRRHLSENAHLPGAGSDVLRAAAALVPAEIRAAHAGAQEDLDDKVL